MWHGFGQSMHRPRASEKNLQGPLCTLLKEERLRRSAFQPSTYRNENINSDVVTMCASLPSGSFDPPTASNIWRIMKKMEKINCLESHGRLADGPRKELEQWRSNMLHSAIKDEKIEIVQLLIDMRIDANAENFHQPALHAAAFRKDLSFVQVLLQH